MTIPDMRPIEAVSVLNVLEAAIVAHLLGRSDKGLDKIVVVMNEWVYFCVWWDCEQALTKFLADANEKYESRGFPTTMTLFGVKIVPSDCEMDFEITEAV